MTTVLIYAVSWIGLAVIGIVNGITREYTYGRFMRELSAHQWSTLIGLVLFGFYIWILTGACPIESAKQSLLIGGMWMTMTVLFEFIFGHYIIGHPWKRLFRDYNLHKGRIWSLVLIGTSIAPYLFYRIRS
jgi:hypothetical protein